MKVEYIDACDNCGRPGTQPNETLCDDCRLFRISLGGLTYRVLRRYDLGFHVQANECPACGVPAGPRGLLAFCGDGGELYCDCGGFHLGPVFRADTPGVFVSYAELREVNRANRA